MICRIESDKFPVPGSGRGSEHEALRGDIGGRGAGRSGGDREQGFAPLAEGDQRVDPAQLRRRGFQRAAGDRRGHRGHSADQHAQGGPGEEALRGRGAGGGAGRPAGPAADVSAQGRRRVRGAPGGAELRRAAGGPRAMVAAAAGGPRGGARLHRQRVARDRAASSKKTRSSPGAGSDG